MHLDLPKLPIVNPLAKVITKDNYASKLAVKILEQIQKFDASIGNEFEVGVRLVSFGQSIIFAVQGISYDDPSLIIFFGAAEDGSPVELIQHVSQISFLLTSLPRQNTSAPKQAIGFRYKEMPK